MGGQALWVQQDTKAYRIYNAKTNKVVEIRNVVFIETPSKLVSPPTNEPDNINDMDNIDILSLHDVQEGHDMLRDVTSRIDFNKDVTYDHTIPIVQPRDPAIDEILTKIRGLTQADIQAGKETPRAPADGVDGLQSPTDDGGGQQPAPGCGSGEQVDPLEGWPPNQRGRHLSIR